MTLDTLMARARAHMIGLSDAHAALGDPCPRCRCQDPVVLLECVTRSPRFAVVWGDAALTALMDACTLRVGCMQLPRRIDVAWSGHNVMELCLT